MDFVSDHKELAPIVLFVYKRSQHARKVLESLSQNFLAKESELYIFSDGPKSKEDEEDVLNVRKCIKEFRDFKKVSITEAKTNRGLSNSIFESISQLFEKHSKIIILEDDVITSPYFLKYMNDSLHLYEHEPRVAGISAFCYPNQGINGDTYFLPIGCSWGWGTWAKKWDVFNTDAADLIQKIKDQNRVQEFDFGGYPFFNMLIDQKNGVIDTWDVNFYASFFLEKMVFLYPRKSLTSNIGFDSSGSHTSEVEKHFNTGLLMDKGVEVRRLEIELVPETCRSVERGFRSRNTGSVGKKLFRVMKRIFSHDKENN